MKKLTAWMISLILLIASAPLCFAAGTAEKTKVQLEELDMTVEVPKGVYVFTSETDPQSSDWLMAGYENSVDKLKEFKADDSGNVMAMELVAEDRSFTVMINRKYSDKSRDYFNLAEVTDEQFQKLIDESTFEDKENGVSAKAEAYEHDQVPFFRVDVKGKVNNVPVWETCYGTIVNGSSLSVDMYSKKELTQEQEDMLAQMVDSIEITKFYEKPTQEQIMMQSLLMLLPIIGVILLIVIFLIVSRVRTKAKDRERAEMADRMAAYRKEQKELEQSKDYVAPPVLFENDTFCSDPVIKQFCQFHLFRKCLLRSCLFVVLGLVSIAMAWFYDSSWLMRLILLGLGVYMIVQPFMSLDKMTKLEIRLYKKYGSRDAHYAFRTDDFRISGIQSPTFYPDFQILNAYETQDYFYLYYSSERAYLLSKNGFKKGNADDFRRALKEQLGSCCHWK